MGLRIDQITGVANTHRRPPAEADRPPVSPELTPGDPRPGRSVTGIMEPSPGDPRLRRSVAEIAESSSGSLHLGRSVAETAKSSPDDPRPSRSVTGVAGSSSGDDRRTRVDELRAVVRSAQDGISAIQTAEAALTQAHSVLHHMRGLASRAAGGGQDARVQQADDQRFTQLKRELDRISAVVSGTGESLDDLSSPALRTGDGIDAAGRRISGGDDLGAFSLGVGAASLVDGADPGNQALNAAAAQAAVTSIDTALQAVSDTRARLGAVQDRFQHAISGLNVVIEQLSAPEAHIRDAAMARQMAAAIRDRIVPQAGTALPAQANQTPRSALKLVS
ncbi:flagellin [Planobispora siamensis]|uniref:Flagellin n=1 Tax=Planobispora siamensis TaxID=936338 RepID=A0A8J3SR44_9ACTN|nr:flagellin [Planobispora siamensis]GIH96864.1 flagellin [Planobispora siamensis]